MKFKSHLGTILVKKIFISMIYVDLLGVKQNRADRSIYCDSFCGGGNFTLRSFGQILISFLRVCPNVLYCSIIH